MPINDGAYESVRFVYQHETDESFVLNIEFHHTDMGPTITLHDFLESGPLALPLSVYTDAVDYLRSRGSIPGAVGIKQAVASPVRQPNRLQPARVAGAVQRPKAKVQPEETESPLSQPVYAPQHAILTADGALETTSPLKIVQKVAAKPTDTIPLDLEEEPDPTNTGLDPEFSLAAAQKKKAEGNKGQAPRLKAAGKIRNRDFQPEVDLPES